MADRYSGYIPQNRDEYVLAKRIIRKRNFGRIQWASLGALAFTAPIAIGSGIVSYLDPQIAQQVNTISAVMSDIAAVSGVALTVAVPGRGLSSLMAAKKAADLGGIGDVFKKQGNKPLNALPEREIRSFGFGMLKSGLTLTTIGLYTGAILIPPSIPVTGPLFLISAGLRVGLMVHRSHTYKESTGQIGATPNWIKNR